MKIYKLKKYGWNCPSCGLPLMLVVSRADDSLLKWIKSGGLYWAEVKMPGSSLHYNESPACSLCYTEFEIQEIIDTIKANEGARFGKEQSGKTNA
jgi:hypothetical protein